MNGPDLKDFMPKPETGNVVLILNEIRHALQRLIDTGEPTTIDLSGFRVTHNGRVFVVRDGTSIAPDGALTVHAGVGRDTTHHQYWGTDGSILSNTGGVVVIYDADGYRARSRRFD